MYVCTYVRMFVFIAENGPIWGEIVRQRDQKRPKSTVIFDSLPRWDKKSSTTTPQRSISNFDIKELFLPRLVGICVDRGTK